MKKAEIWKINKNDIILAAILAAASVILFVIFLTVRGNETGRSALITVNGEQFGQYDLSVDRQILVETESGINMVEISQGQVSVTDADCPDGYCVSEGTISRKGQTIVCLPHRLVIEIRSEQPDDEDIDIIAK